MTWEASAVCTVSTAVLEKRWVAFPVIGIQS
jgi:hypothetical protein